MARSTLFNQGKLNYSDNNQNLPKNIFTRKANRACTLVIYLTVIYSLPMHHYEHNRDSIHKLLKMRILREEEKRIGLKYLRKTYKRQMRENV